jgi:TPP-dependent indolepyruvate ferredoxin oxidoreductase alpha subunit
MPPTAVQVLKVGVDPSRCRAKMVESVPLLGEDTMLVVEELEPYLETGGAERSRRRWASRCTIHGKATAAGSGFPLVPRMYELLSADRIRPALGAAGRYSRRCSPSSRRILPPLPGAAAAASAPAAPTGPATTRSRAVADVFDTYFANDIGCYTLGLLPPLQTVRLLPVHGFGRSLMAQRRRRPERAETSWRSSATRTFFHSRPDGAGQRGAQPPRPAAGGAGQLHHRDDRPPAAPLGSELVPDKQHGLEPRPHPRGEGAAASRT